MSAVLRESDYLIRKMLNVDLPKVYENEVAAYTHPWTAGILSDCLRSGYACQVVEQDNHLVGHGVLSAAAGEAHLLNLCISPDWQGKGLGRKLLHRMVRLASEAGADTVFLEVRVSNQSAQLLYQSEGFCEIGQRRAYYPHDEHGREDAVLFAKPLF